ncbi:MAG TPA: acyl-CoA thioesterase [Daejeonella sp.]|uniref:acyl-CoA thioesterase n=1 Tax=Daejeonella sp. TaxID=2805397 RepID=UPI002EDA90D2
METLTLEKEVESQTLVRFPDCDPFNHLNNSKYIDYIINAREDQLLKYYDIDIHKMVKETGLTWVVAQNNISYLVPAEIMETVTIQTRLLSYNEKTLLLEALMWDKDKKIIKAVMWSKQAHYNLLTKRSHQHSEEFMDFFKSVHYPLPNNMLFDERVKSLKQQNLIQWKQAI